MDVFGGVPAGSPHDDSFAVLIPFQDGSGADAKLPTHFCGMGDLPFGSDFGTCECHTSEITMAMDMAAHLRIAASRLIN